MSPKIRILLVAFLLTTTNVLTPAQAFAHGDEHHDKPAISAQNAATDLGQTIEKLTKLVASKQLAPLHAVIEQADHSLDSITVAPAQQARFQGAAKQLQQHLTALHTAADSGNQAASEAAIKRINSAWSLLRTTLK